MGRTTFRNQSGFALLYVLVPLVVLIVIVVGVWLVISATKEKPEGKPIVTPKANSVAGGSDSQTSKPLTAGSDDQSLAKDITNLAASVDEGEQNLASAATATNDESQVIDVPTGSDSLTLIKTRANAEIDRRQDRLKQLSQAIAGSTRLRAGDKSDLKSQVQTESGKLAALKSQIDADADVASARINAQSIFNEYRFFALVTAKVWQIRVADDQQVLQNKFNVFSGKLQTRINAARNAGKDVDKLQTALNDLIVKVEDAQKLSGPTEKKLLPLEPTDFSNDHTILSGYLDGLESAHSGNKKAYADAKIVVDGIKGM